MKLSDRFALAANQSTLDTAIQDEVLGVLEDMESAKASTNKQSKKLFTSAEIVHHLEDCEYITDALAFFRGCK